MELVLFTHWQADFPKEIFTDTKSNMKLAKDERRRNGGGTFLLSSPFFIYTSPRVIVKQINLMHCSLLFIMFAIMFIYTVVVNIN